MAWKLLVSPGVFGSAKLLENDKRVIAQIDGASVAEEIIGEIEVILLSASSVEENA